MSLSGAELVVLLITVGAHDDKLHDYVPGSGYSKVLPDDETSHSLRDAFRFVY